MTLLNKDSSRQKHRSSGSIKVSRAVNNTIPFCILQNRVIRYANTSFQSFVGRELSSILDNPIDKLFLSKKKKSVLPEKLPWADGVFDPGMFVHGYFSTGAGPLPVRLTVFRIVFHGTDAILIIAEDQTRFRNAMRKMLGYRQSIRKLRLELLASEERQRRQIAAELHDGITQSLAVIRMQLGTLLQQDGGPGDRRQIEEIRDLVDETINDARGMVFTLSPPVLFDLGFDRIIADLLDEFRHRYAVPVSLDWQAADVTIGDDLRMYLFRILRELMMNVVKHAEAGEVRVSCRGERGMFRIEVVDNGKGIDEVSGSRKRSFGLLSIRERVTSLGGSVRIESVPGCGTAVSVTVPVHPEIDNNQPL